MVVWQAEDSRIQKVSGQAKTTLLSFVFPIPDFQRKPFDGPSKEQRMKKQLVQMSTPNDGGQSESLRSNSMLTWKACLLPRNLNFFLLDPT